MHTLAYIKVKYHYVNKVVTVYLYKEQRAEIARLAVLGNTDFLAGLKAEFPKATKIVYATRPFPRKRPSRVTVWHS